MLSFFSKKQPLSNLEWLGTDLNSHLLVLNENGSVDIPNSINCIRQLYGLGIKSIYCFYPVTTIKSSLSEIIITTKTQLESALIESGLDVTVVVGAKYIVDKSFIVSKDLIALLDCYIFLELSLFNEPQNLEEVVFNLQISGYKVILASPEQYAYYQNNKSRYRRLKNLGVLFQLNIMSLTGHYGSEVKTAALYLLEKSYYDLAGTGAHSDKHIDLIKKIVLNRSIFDKIRSYKFKNRDLLK